MPALMPMWLKEEEDEPTWIPLDAAEFSLEKNAIALLRGGWWWWLYNYNMTVVIMSCFLLLTHDSDMTH